jgi:signal transduction histidine kinase
MVMGDAIRLQQIFWNPIRNAIKFTPDGGRIIVQTHNDGAGSVLIEVTDTGRGLEASQLTRIFSPFDQGDGLTTAHFGGLGLGLAISQGLTEAHGGTITANSPGAGCGATFQVRLPTRLAESRSALAAEKVS